MLRTVLGWIVVAAIFLYVIANPAQVGNLLSETFHAAGTLIASIGGAIGQGAHHHH